MSKDKYNNPWEEALTPEQQIQYREPVVCLDEEAVFRLIEDFEKYIKEKDHAGIYSLFSLDLEATLYILVNNEITSYHVGRDPCCYSFYSYVGKSDTKNYKMNINEIKMVEPNHYNIKINITGFGNEEIDRVYGKDASCEAEVTRYKNIPVISKFVMESNNG